MKIGDKVVCVENRAFVDGKYQDGMFTDLFLIKVYEVESVSDSTIDIVGMNGRSGWLKERFVLLPSQQ